MGDPKEFTKGQSFQTSHRTAETVNVNDNTGLKRQHDNQEKESNKVQVEDVTKEESDDEMPALEQAKDGADAGAGGAAGKQSRTEKKSRKAIGKLGMKPVPGIMRVTVKKARNILFVIANPDVYKSPNSDTYVIFGEAKIEDYSGEGGLTDSVSKYKNQADVGAASNLNDLPNLEPVSGSDAGAPAGASAPAAPGTGASSGSEAEPSAEGLREEDIAMVAEQGKTTRAKAIEALRKSNNDMVQAIVSLSL
eukprot:TRINITY_DN25901_c0_g1_i1.p1 TRINITY_DN25901_c0_g1~~TRINITY_DN25901_c0_g1_i1.p1  ORF type:complete len:250 (+),score=86.33 TRINITY_DN25901_c0_g1_i1:64-813(+)